MKTHYYRKTLSAALLALGCVVSLSASAGGQNSKHCPKFGLSYISDSRLAVFVKAPSSNVTATELCLDGQCSAASRNGHYFISEFDATLNEYYTISAETVGKFGQSKHKQKTAQFGQENCLDQRVSSAPSSIAGLDVVLSITNTESDLPGGFPTMGAVVQSYAEGGSYEYQGFGGGNHLTGDGTYSYQRMGLVTAEENALQNAPTFNLPYTMEYTFTTDQSGYWTQYFAGGVIVFEGTFTVTEADAAPYLEYAPESIEGHSLMIQVDTDQRQRTFRNYEEQGQYTDNGGRHTSTTGQYNYQKLSSNSAVEEYVDGTGPLDEGFVRVYTFKSPKSGEWYEKSRDGEIENSGSFKISRQKHTQR